MGECPKCHWVGNTREDHYVDAFGVKGKVDDCHYCPDRFSLNKNGQKTRSISKDSVVII